MTQHGIILLLVGPMVPNLMRTFEIGESMAGVLLGMGSLAAGRESCHVRGHPRAQRPAGDRP